MNGRYLSQTTFIQNKRRREIPTQALYIRATEHFQHLLEDTVKRHEVDALYAYERFKRQRLSDRDHFERSQRNSAKLCREYDAARAREQFEMEEEKLLREHEEECHKAYPLGSMGVHTVAVLTKTLVPRLRHKLSLLEKQFTHCYKINCQEQEGEALHGFHQLLNLVQARVREHRGVNSVTALASKLSGARDGLGQYDVNALSAGRGAYITREPDEETRCHMSTSGRGTEVNVVECEASTAGGEQDVSVQREQVEAVLGGIFSTSTDIFRTGVADFVHAGFILNAESQREICDEKRLFLRNYMEKCDPMERGNVERALKRLEDDEAQYKMKHNRVLEALKVAKDALVTLPRSEEREAEGSGEGKRGSSPGVSVSLRQLCEGAPPLAAEPAVTPTVRSATGPTDCQRQRSKNTPATTRDHEWSTLNLDDKASDYPYMEKLAQLYMWPEEVEKRIRNTLCGRVVSVSTRLHVEQYQLGNLPHDDTDPQHGLTQDQVGNATPTALSKKRPLTFRIPSHAEDVWLRVNHLGEFTARRMRILVTKASQER